MSDDNKPEWRKKLQPASFRDQPFSVKSSQAQVGRRTVVHEYPQRDDAFAEDMGRKARAFTIEAIVIGPNYMEARDALIEAIEERGSGQLVHPYYGRRIVSLVNPARISESDDEGGMARFSLDFIETGENTEPTTRDDTPSLVEESADDAMKSIADEFADKFSLDGLPDFASLGALDIARDVMGALDSLRSGLVPDLSVLSEYMGAANGMMGSLGSLLRSPSAFAGELLGLFSGLTGLASSPLSALMSYRGLFGYGTSKSSSGSSGDSSAYTRYGSPLPDIPLVTPSRISQSDNQESIAALTRVASLVEATRVSSRIEYESFDQAISIRDELSDRLDDEAAGISPDGSIRSVSEPVYEALTNLRVAMVRDITTRGADLAKVSTTQLPSTMPALVAAYKIFGDANRADELVSRNSKLIRHPGFVPGGQPLEILIQ